MASLFIKYLPAKSSRPSSKRSFFEHVLLRWIDSPVVTLAGPAQCLRELDEALVEGQVVTHRILPALVGTSEEMELCLKTRV